MQEHAMHDMGAQAHYAPGARVVIRDREWIVRRADPSDDGGYMLTVDGLAEPVSGKSAQFIIRLDSVGLQRMPNHFPGSRNSFYDSMRAPLRWANGNARRPVVKAAAAVKALVLALRSKTDMASMSSNTPAKPRWTSVLMLKSSGFFIACRSGCFRDLGGGAAS